MGVVGIVDPEAPVEEDDVARREICDEAESVTLLRKEVERLRNEDGVALVVVLSSAIDPRINQHLMETCPTIDVLVTISEPQGGNRLTHNGTHILSPGWDGQSIEVLDIPASREGNAGGRSREVNVLSSDYLPDDGIRKKIRRYWIDKIRTLDDDRLVGSTDKNGVPYDIEHDLWLEYPYWRYFNRPMFNFVADAVREEFTKRPYSGSAELAPPLPNQPYIAFYNTGAIETGLPPDIVTLSDLRRAIPYDNKIVPCRLTAAQIRALLNSSAMKERGLLAVSGAKYVWDYSKGLVDVWLLDKDGHAERLKEGTYNVLLTDFLLAGGDLYLSGLQFQELRSKFARLKTRPKESPDYPSTVELLERFLRRKSPVSATTDDRVVFQRGQ